MEEIRTLVDFRKRELFYYSPYNFVRAFSEDKQLTEFVYKPILAAIDKGDHALITVGGHKYYFIYSFLSWDTNYFGIKTYRLDFVLYNNPDYKLLRQAVKLFLEKVLATPQIYMFFNVPSEDIALIQALGANGFKLVETRVTYYNAAISSFNNERFKARLANEGDILNLMRVAKEMRNDYDRFHADKIFSPDVADNFLATYIEQSIKGFADVTLVPGEEDVPADSFLTAKYLEDEWPVFGVNISKMVLSAVSGKTNRGWYKKLISEMTYFLRERGAEVVFMNTQSTNRAVVHTWETLGYKYGSSMHVLSINS